LFKKSTGSLIFFSLRKAKVLLYFVFCFLLRKATIVFRCFFV
jgi:hypothetical protein